MLCPGSGVAGVTDLARAGRWGTIVNLARARDGQLPLRPDEALVVAAAARRVGNEELRRLALTRAAAAPGELGAVARVELAQLVVSREPELAADLVEPVLSPSSPPRLLEASMEVVERAAPALGASRRAALRRTGRRLHSRERRRLELALAVPDDRHSAYRLRRLLEEKTTDGVALTAVTRLLAAGALDDRTLWPAAQALYRHALYGSAVPVLEALEHHRPSGVPRWRVAFLRGRCAFRLDRWAEAASWYRRALSRCHDRTHRAELRIHLARTLELSGDLDAALQATVRARTARDSDGRRLFELRLLLRLERPGEAESLLRSVRRREERDRGVVLLALDDLRQGRAPDARRRLEAVRRRPWRGPARVMAAKLALAAGAPDEAAKLLQEAAAERLSGFWSDRARALAGALPEPLLAGLRARLADELAAARGAAADDRRARWARIEPEPSRIPPGPRPADAGLRAAPEPPSGLAGQLWELGLEAEAARWDPEGFPEGAGALWSATRLHDLGETRLAIRLAETGRTRSWPEMPATALPPDVQRRLYPLPAGLAPALRDLAADRGLPWPLLAGLVREESRWDAGALSRVGARGLTQLMPSTAALVAASVGQPAPDPEDLFQPQVALRLGSIELGRLLSAFGGRWAPAVAAYNAGEAQSRLWLDECGAGCSDERFLLTVSFDATRAYTEHVLESAAMYARVESADITARSGSPPAAPSPAPASS